MEALIQLTTIWIGVLFAVLCAKKTRLTPVLYFLAVGALLVNTGLLPEQPHEFIRGFAEIGIILIMFAIGFEELVDEFLSSVRQSWGIAFFGAIAPFTATYSLTWWFWQDFATALMCGLAMTATAVSLTMVTLRAEGLGKSTVATRVMTSAVLDDVASLALVAILIPVAAGGATPSMFELGVIIGKVILFFFIVAGLSTWVFPHNTSGWLATGILRHINLRNLLAFEQGQYTTLVLLILALVIGLLAHSLGFHPAVGAYMAGLVLKEEYFSFGDTSAAVYKETERVINNVAFAWIGPVFFVVLGTHLVFDWTLMAELLPQAIALTILLFVVQVLSAGMAARYTAGMNFTESVMIGFGMLGRAELAFVVLDIAYVQYAILSNEAFYILMMTAFCLNISVPLSIRWWKTYYEKQNSDYTEIA